MNRTGKHSRVNGTVRSPAGGWLQVAWSRDVADGAVSPARLFGHDLVIYRGCSGGLHALDAHCQHLGAHLGHGGTVEGEQIRCPFHGWVWSPEGRNEVVPYSDNPCRSRRLGVWSVTEWAGAVLIWFSSG